MKNNIMKKLLSILFICLTLCACSKSVDAKSLVGAYQDCVSKRASATIDIIENDKLSIDITWSSSAQEEDKWLIVAEVNNNKITYDDITHLINNYDNFGNVNSTKLDDYKSGYFEIKENKLYWTGSNNEQTSKCVFEKVVD